MLFDIPEPKLDDKATIFKKWSTNEVISDSNNEEVIQHFICYLCSERVNNKSPFFKISYKEKTVITTDLSPVLALAKKRR